MRIWVDADACPLVIKEILFKAAIKRSVRLTMVANKPVRIPICKFIDIIQVSAGFDVADSMIVQSMSPGDIVVTADIPLADEVISKKGVAINPRGQLYTEENIKDRLATRDLMDELRGTGMITGGPSAFNLKDRHAFANQLDRLLQRHSK